MIAEAQHLNWLDAVAIVAFCAFLAVIFWRAM